MISIPSSYPRDMIGYGTETPRVRWPGEARVAVQFVLNYEEGGENAVLHGDPASEAFLSEIIGAQPLVGARHLSIESLFEYGSRVGVWRVLSLFRERGVPITLFAVAMALERNPKVAEVALLDGHEICSHGYRWIDYHDVPEEIEREHMARAIEIQTRITGERPLGWYTGRTSENTRRLVAEDGSFVYDSDDYSDDLPFWSRVVGKPHLVVPYTLDANDMRFTTAQGFNTADHFFRYLRDGFDALYAEGETTPKLMSVGLHGRIIGRPGRIGALARFIEHVLAHDRVWLARRIDVARCFMDQFPAGFSQESIAACRAEEPSDRDCKLASGSSG